MGFDKHFYEDHCYWDDPADGVGMNVEIIADNTQVIHSVEDIRYLEMSGSSNSNIIDNYEVFNNGSKKALIYLPFNEYCTDHSDMILHEDEKLVKPGDKFDSHDDFIQYLNENAKRWCFYYKCSDSHKPNTEYETYTYNCVYLRNKEKYKKKGIRKRNNNMKTDCPCKIKLRHLPNEKELTVVFVCNHHDHELSIKEFNKLQHGRRLPPHVKEEILDLLALKVDVLKIRAYVEMETGFNMSRPFFHALEKNMKSRNEQRLISEERLRIFTEKIAVVDEMYGCKYNHEGKIDNQTQHRLEQGDVMENTKKSKHRIKNTEKNKRIPTLKRRSKTNDEVTSSDDTKRSKPEETYNNETSQSVKDLQESVQCEILTNAWVSDQCVPVLPNRTGINSECDQYVHVQTIEPLNEVAQSNAQDGSLSYAIQYYSEDSAHEIVSNEVSETNNDGQVSKNEENGIDNIAYETVITDDQDGAQNEILEYVNDDQIIHESVEYHIEEDNVAVLNEVADISNAEIEANVNNIVEYTIEEDNEVEYVDDVVNEATCAQDVGVQTVNSTSSHSLLPVFDVYMKDGNVTGFVVNNNLINGLKDGVDKSIQTNEELLFCDSQDWATEDFDGEIIHDTSPSSESTYTKHEYVHKYNLDKYMVQPHFPKYVETLAKETYMDVLHMFTNIYNEKAMFKITTTHKGKEGDTRIWYITDVPKFLRRRREVSNDKRSRQHISELKKRVRTLKKQNSELVIRNKLLEDVALRFVEM